MSCTFSSLINNFFNNKPHTAVRAMSGCSLFGGVGGFMKAIIIDDERLARLELRKLLQDFPEVEIVDEAANAEEGIAKIEAQNPDLIFLDIQMPGKTGFDMLASLERSPNVIFTTAYDEYALKAF